MLWDIFCRVIDNYGDIGVSWRLCADLAAREQRVRLWVDDSSALRWMAPGALEGKWPRIQVMPWQDSCQGEVLQALPAADVWIEAFGCEVDETFVAHRAHFCAAKQSARPVWINLEYLSAEPYVERCHGLPSPVMQGPAKGWIKHFFYPGFSKLTGGLLREPGLIERQNAHNNPVARNGFCDLLKLAPGPDTHREKWVSLFCYEPPALGAVLAQWAASATPVRLLVTSGRATRAVRALLGAQTALGSLRVAYLPVLSQTDFDRLLWSCDLNFVRGEDSVVRALWAGKPFVWQIYPQHDLAHAAKLEAFLEHLQLGPDVCQMHRAWNGLARPDDAANALLPATTEALLAWQTQVLEARARLLEMDDLGSALGRFAMKNR